MPLEPVDPPCEQCEGRGWILAADGSAGTAAACPCQAVNEAALLLERARIPLRYRRKTLGNFEVSSPSDADHSRLYEASQRSRHYVERFVGSDGNFRQSGLLFIGRPGGGKTHLAVGVLRALIERYRVRGRFVDFTTLVHEIQATFDPGSEESKRQVLDPVIDAEVLVLDELGAQRPTAFVNDILYLVLNTRYTRCLPTLFTTNYPLEEVRSESRSMDGPARLQDTPTVSLASRIPARLVSRLYEMAQPIVLPDADFRRDIGAAQSYV